MSSSTANANLRCQGGRLALRLPLARPNGEISLRKQLLLSIIAKVLKGVMFYRDIVGYTRATGLQHEVERTPSCFANLNECQQFLNPKFTFVVTLHAKCNQLKRPICHRVTDPHIPDPRRICCSGTTERCCQKPLKATLSYRKSPSPTLNLSYIF